MEYLSNYDQCSGSNIDVNNQTQTILDALTDLVERRQGTNLNPENENTRQCPEQNPQFSINLTGPSENFQDFGNQSETIGQLDESEELTNLIDNLTNVNNFRSVESANNENVDCLNLKDYIDDKFTNKLASCNCKL